MEEYECEKRLRQKMAEKVGDLQSKLDEERQKSKELKFIREKDNEEIIRLEQDLNTKTEYVVVRYSSR